MKLKFEVDTGVSVELKEAISVLSSILNEKEGTIKPERYSEAGQKSDYRKRVEAERVEAERVEAERVEAEREAKITKKELMQMGKKKVAETGDRVRIKKVISKYGDSINVVDESDYNDLYHDLSELKKDK